MRISRRLLLVGAILAIHAVASAQQSERPLGEFRLVVMNDDGSKVLNNCAVRLSPALLPRSTQPIEMPCGGEHGIALPVPFEGPATIEVLGGNYWLPPVLVTELRGEKTLTVFRVTDLNLAVVGEPAVQGSGVSAVSEVVGGNGEAIRGAVRCSLVDRTVSCRVPKTVQDLRVEVDGNVPRYFWGVALDRELLPQLQLDLVRGPSLSGWIEQVAESQVSQLELDLTPQVAPTPNIQCRKEPKKPKATVAAASRCFFQVGPIPLGTYGVQAMAGLSKSQARTVEVRTLSETEVPGPLHLFPPLEASFSIRPPANLLGGVWRGEFAEVRGGVVQESIKRTSTATREGELKFHNLGPGTYELALISGTEDVVLRRVFELQDRSLSETLTVDAVEVEGQVSCDGEVLKGQLFAGGTFSRSKVVLETDLEGRFHGFLPAKEFNEVTFITSTAPPVDYQLTATDLSGMDPFSVQVLEWALPSTNVSFRVEDAKGTSVAGAYVNMVSKERRRREWSAQTDSEGRVVARCVEPGELLAGAFFEGKRSGWRPIEISEGEDQDVVLVLEETVEISGQVRVNGIGIGGAWIDALPRSQVQSSSRATQSAADGSFKLNVPVGQLDLVINGGSFAMAVRRVTISADGDAPILLDLDPVGGTLTLEPPPVPRDTRALRHSGAEVSLGLLFGIQIQRLGPAITVLGDAIANFRVESGQYELCAGGVNAVACDAGNVEAWSVLTLSLERESPESSDVKGEARDGSRKE